MIHCAEVVGYAWDAQLWCVDCFETIMVEKDIPDDEYGTMFHDNKSDYLQTCTQCAELIHCELISKDGLLSALARIVYTYLHDKTFQDYEVRFDNGFYLNIFNKDFDLQFELFREGEYENYGQFDIDEDKSLHSIKEELESIIPDEWSFKDLWFDYTDVFSL